MTISISKRTKNLYTITTKNTSEFEQITPKPKGKN